MSTIPDPNSDSPRGLVFALAAYVLWGFLPLYMKSLDHISPFEIIAHRVIWSLPIAAGVLIWQGRTSDVRAAIAKPRLLATWTPMANNQLRFRFERELGQLDFGDFAASAELSDGTVFGGNVDLEPEQRWISELTYERRFWGEGVVSIGYRHDRIIDVIDRLPLPGGLSATGNIGDGTLDQLSLNVVVPLDKVGISGARFTFRNDWNKTSVTDPTTGEDRRISGVRTSQANVGFQQDITSWKTQWGVNWLPRLGQATYDPDQTFAWRGADYLEAFVEYKPSPTLSLRAQLNLWDDFTTRRTVYANRTTRPVAYTEERFIDPRTFFQIRLRKTF